MNLWAGSWVNLSYDMYDKQSLKSAYTSAWSDLSNTVHPMTCLGSMEFSCEQWRLWSGWVKVWYEFSHVAHDLREVFSTHSSCIPDKVSPIMRRLRSAWSKFLLFTWKIYGSWGIYWWSKLPQSLSTCIIYMHMLIWVCCSHIIFDIRLFLIMQANSDDSDPSSIHLKNLQHSR